MGKEPSFYHVFLSFRGETRDNFSCFLHEALKAQGFQVFFDEDEIETGDEVDSRIKEGIRISLSAIIVFTPDYTSSAWCLDELVLFVQRLKSSRFLIIPILFDVQSKTIKYQDGKYGEALEKHKYRHENKVAMWKEALAEVGRLRGEHVKGAYNIFIKNTVKQFRGKLASMFPELGLPIQNRSVGRNSIDANLPPESIPLRPKTTVLHSSQDNKVAQIESPSYRRVETSYKAAVAKDTSYLKSNLNIVRLGNVVLNFGYSCFKKKMQCMDDLYETIRYKVKNQIVAFFGVYDDKGGVSSTAEYLKKYLLRTLVSHRDFIADTKSAVLKSFQRTDTEYLNREQRSDAGSTAVIVILLGDQLLVANVGDCRVVAFKSGYSIPLSSDHKPNRYDEHERIKDAGGFVSWEGTSTDLKPDNFDKFQRVENDKYLTIEWPGTWKVENVPVSRGFGYRSVKKYVIAKPDIQIEDIHGVSFLIIGTAGLWNVLSNKDAVGIVQNIYDSKAASEKLIQEAYAKGSTEDIRCLVVRFKTW